MNVQIHIVKKSDGTNVGFNESLVDQTITNLNNAFASSSISFRKVGVDYIYDNNLYYLTEPYVQQLITSNVNPNALNFYIVANHPLYSGLAFISGGTLVVLQRTLVAGTTSQHEMGHALGLYHTFAGTAESFLGSCPELINGTNCSICGDYVCDTPADGNIGNNGGYNPDLTNYMSYYNTRNHFTPDQFMLIKNEIETSPNLIQSKSNLCKSISGPDSFCQGQSTTFYISEQDTNLIHWSVTGNLNINSLANSYSNVTIVATNGASSTGTITATFPNGEIVTKLVNIGPPNLSNIDKSIHSYDWYPTTGIQSYSVGVSPSSNGISYVWTIALDDLLLPNCTGVTNPSYPRIIDNGSTLTATTPAYFNTTSNIITINWGKCRGFYVLSCSTLNTCPGESAYLTKYVTVDKPTNNPCNQPIVSSKLTISPNPIKDGTLTVNIATNQLPCNYSSSFVNNKLRNSYKTMNIYDFYGNLKYSTMFTEDEIFTVKDLKFISGNYLLNIILENGDVLKQMIIFE